MNNRSATIEVLAGNSSQMEKESRKGAKARKERSSQNSVDGLYGKPKAQTQMSNYGAPPRQMQSALNNYSQAPVAGGSFNQAQGNSLNKLPTYGSSQNYNISGQQANSAQGAKVRRKRDFSQVIDPTTNQNVIGTNLTGGAGVSATPN